MTTGSRGHRARAAAGGTAVALLAFAALAPARADESLTPGSGAASSQVFVFNIPYSGANIGFGVGITKARFFEQNATAAAQTFDPGFVGLANVVHICNEGAPVSVPPATTADTNRTGGQAESNHKDTGGGFGGIEDASATPGSAGDARVTGATFSLGGIASLSGGASHSTSTLESDTLSRRATNDAEMGGITLLDGMVQLDGLHWHLDQTVVGADSRAHIVDHHATFTVQGARLAGVPLPTGTPEQLATTIDMINAAIAPVGLQLRLPALVDNGAQGFAFSPLTIAIGGNTAYGTVLYPYLAGSSDLSLINLFNKLTQPTVFDAATCNELGGLLKNNPQLNSTWNTLGVLTPILISAFAAAINGGAEVDLNVGGARTNIDDTYYAPRPPYVAPARTAPVVPDTPDVASRPTVAVQSGAPPPAPPIALVQNPGSTTQRCATTSPVGRPGCWRGTAPLAAGLLGGITLALIITDEVWRRRRLGLIEEVTD